MQQIADEVIEDSPYQARRPFRAESVEELVQGMFTTGFQGVLVVRRPLPELHALDQCGRRTAGPGGRKGDRVTWVSRWPS